MNTNGTPTPITRALLAASIPGLDREGRLVLLALRLLGGRIKVDHSAVDTFREQVVEHILARRGESPTAVARAVDRAAAPAELGFRGAVVALVEVGRARRRRRFREVRLELVVLPLDPALRLRRRGGRRRRALGGGLGGRDLRGPELVGRLDRGSGRRRDRSVGSGLDGHSWRRVGRVDGRCCRGAFGRHRRIRALRLLLLLLLWIVDGQIRGRLGDRRIWHVIVGTLRGDILRRERRLLRRERRLLSSEGRLLSSEGRLLSSEGRLLS